MPLEDGMDFCYVLYVRTGHEEKVRLLLVNRLEKELFTPFIPKKIMVFRRQGKYSKVHRVCFPGYVFIKSVLPPATFISRMFPVVYPIREVFRFLHYGSDRNDVALRDNERYSLLQLLDDTYTINCVIGIKNGDRIQIISGPFIGKEGTVKKVNPRKREVIIEIEIFGNSNLATLGLDIVEAV